MSAQAQPDKFATAAAEEVLRAIYGDDFQGCVVRLEDIAAIIQRTMEARAERDKELLGLYEKVVEGLHTLSTPPGTAVELGPNELRDLLSERLDTIRTLTTKVMQTTAKFQKETEGN
ncbi:MAG TPA: hypothetical protein VGE41_04645 [Verrucomicrobiae bacterium]|jgi:hypothetical protein